MTGCVRCSLRITSMMPNTVATCTGLVPHISRMAAGPTATKVIHRRSPMVIFSHHHLHHQPRRRANFPRNTRQKTVSYCDGTGCRRYTFVKFGDVLKCSIAKDTSLRHKFYVICQLELNREDVSSRRSLNTPDCCTANTCVLFFSKTSDD